VDERGAAEQVGQGQSRDEDAGIQSQVAAVAETDNDEYEADRKEESRRAELGLGGELTGARKSPRTIRKMPMSGTRRRLPGQLPSKLQLSTRTALGGSCLLTTRD